MQIVIATANLHKADEIRVILPLPGVEWLCAANFPDIPDVVEDGDTFRLNARKKAMTVAKATGLWSLGDDSGLEVDALNGDPGVFSARYAGTHGDTPANNRKLLAEMDGVKDRGAQFRCAMSLASPDGRLWEADGICRGRILKAPSGTAGFGYDPLFVPDGWNETFAELGAAVKNKVSHRAKALDAMRGIIESILSGDNAGEVTATL